MMIETKTFPTTLEELHELGPGPHFFPATFDEFLTALPETELRAEYVDDQIVLMSYATLIHEVLITRLITLFGQLDQSLFLTVGSNHRVSRKAMTRAFAPDIFVVKGKPKHFRPPGKVSMITNPWLIVEVLSPGTQAYDLGTKLPTYKKFLSAHYILYVYQTEPRLTLHTRIDRQLWRSEDYDLESDPLSIETLSLEVADIYSNLPEAGEEE